jgi:hypothetical protein
VGVIFALIILAVFTLPAKKATPHRLLKVTVDTNGVARLNGIPLASTNVRDAAFQAIGSAGLKASYAEVGYTNEIQRSNALETLNSMTRAGLFSTNRPPNPYE